MNLARQSEVTVMEIENFYAFWRRINRCNALRSLGPRNAYGLMRIRYKFVWRNLLKRRPVDDLRARQARLDLLCSEAEKSNPFHEVIRSDPYNNYHALSEHLNGTFPEFNWLALEDVTRLRLDQIPRIRLMSLLNFLIVLLSSSLVLSGYRIFESHLAALDMSDEVYATGLTLIAYAIVVILSFLVITHAARKRLRRVVSVLGYMAIRARTDEALAVRT